MGIENTENQVDVEDSGVDLETDPNSGNGNNGTGDRSNSANSNSDNSESQSIAELRQQVADLKKQLTKDTNGVAKKIQSQIDALKNSQTPQPQPLPDKDKEMVTVEALKNEIALNNQKISDIQSDYTKKIEQMKIVQEEKERKIFIAGIKSNLVNSFSENGFDDIPNVLSVFLGLHPEANFIEGSDGIVIYKKDPRNKNDKGVTIDTLFSDWKETAIAKRFIPADKPPQGSGSTESATPGRTSAQKTTPGKSKTQEILDRIKEGTLEFKPGYY